MDKSHSAALEAMIAVLEDQLSAARVHSIKMREAVAESGWWSLAEDRGWIRDAADEAEQMVCDAEDRLAAGRRIVARTLKPVEDRRA